MASLGHHDPVCEASLAPEPGFSYGFLRNRGLSVAQQVCCPEAQESKVLLADGQAVLDQLASLPFSEPESLAVVLGGYFQLNAEELVLLDEIPVE